MGTVPTPSSVFPSPDELNFNAPGVPAARPSHPDAYVEPADAWPAGHGDTTDEDVDRMWAEEMARRDAAAVPAGYIDASCLACAVALFVPANQRAGDVMCNRCSEAAALEARVEDLRVKRGRCESRFIRGLVDLEIDKVEAAIAALRTA